MLKNLSLSPSLISTLVAQLRDQELQQDRVLFRQRVSRLGELLGYEISKELTYKTVDVKTPLGISTQQVLEEEPVLVTILRAGLALHQGLTTVFEKANHAFVSAYRAHKPDQSFEIKLEYVACSDLSGKTLIVSDPMLATGRSMVATLAALKRYGTPKKIHVASVIAAQAGVDYLLKEAKEVTLWSCAVDPVLNDHAYIVPGLGDAGDLAFGPKLQR